jgi:hypothetical protein
MRRVIVHDDVNVETVRDAGVDRLEKVQKLGSPMTLVAFASTNPEAMSRAANSDVCAVANIRMGPAFGNAGHHWQDRLLAIKGLSLALLVDAQAPTPDEAAIEKDRRCPGLCRRTKGHWKA